MKRLLVGSIVMVLFLSACDAGQITTPPLPPTLTSQETTVSPIDTPEITVTNEVIPEDTAQVTPQPIKTEPPSMEWLAYIGNDGNLWLLNWEFAETRQITDDGMPFYLPNGDRPQPQYSLPSWSSDGKLLAFQESINIQLADRLGREESLKVYDLATQQIDTLLTEESITGFAWQPKTHVLTYTLAAALNYFTARGKVDATLANGIMAVNAESGEVWQMVEPAGFTLMRPQWSPDGRFISFDEGRF